MTRVFNDKLAGDLTLSFMFKIVLSSAYDHTFKFICGSPHFLNFFCRLPHFSIKFAYKQAFSMKVFKKKFADCLQKCEEIDAVNRLIIQIL